MVLIRQYTFVISKRVINNHLYTAARKNIMELV